jgi:hypothetical protein
MPTATPVPRGPSLLALGSAAELLTRPGCPVCRYTAEAADRYLGWFASEAHADPVTITRLCASMGTCAEHARALMSQPGAAGRLTAVYRYVLEAAQAKLAGRVARLPGCPACDHDQAASRRALDMLLEGLADPAIRERYRAVGGLCVPHARTGARMRGHRHAVAWMIQAVSAGLRMGPPGLDVLAGGPDHDAARRAELWAAIPPAGRVPPRACPVCLAAARSQREALVRTVMPGGGHQRTHTGDDEPGGGRCLCAAHLRDAALMDRHRMQALLAWQARCQAAALGRPSARRRGGHLARLLRGAPSRSRDAVSCPACWAGKQAARQELGRCGATLRERLEAGDGPPALCVRHVLALRTADPGAGRVAAELAAQQGRTLLDELAEAFRKSTWEYRNEMPGQEVTAWRRAAGFLDGGVFGGCPPG